MTIRPARSVAFAILLILVAGVAFATIQQTLNIPISTAQVGVAYSSSCSASVVFGTPNYVISAGALPTGLILNPTTGAIPGIPTAAGLFTFTCQFTDIPVFDDPQAPPTGPDGQAAARRRTLAQSGDHAAVPPLSLPASITVSGAPGAIGAPTSPWTLCMMMAGLAAVAFFHLRQKRRA